MSPVCCRNLSCDKSDGNIEHCIRVNKTNIIQTWSVSFKSSLEYLETAMQLVIQNHKTIWKRENPEH